MAKRYAAVCPPTAERVDTPCGPVPYTLTRKRVRNLNVRVAADGTVQVSAPPRMPKGEIEAFLCSKAAWLHRHRHSAPATPPPGPPAHSKQAALGHFGRLLQHYFPLFAGVLGGQPPALKIRDMKSRWGTCHVQKRIITINQRLMEKPLAAQEYVMLHEYVHFLHPNHGPAFHAEMARLMPDYKARRQLLK